ncbi:MAG: hypothetical protein Q4A25_01955 [Candidatus Saccharibacteria bacterium]|nr:hypothetical protein [Candidatus Saccharibacteria bacterium]
MEKIIFKEDSTEHVFTETVALKEELVKYIFPGTRPEVALGEDGYIVHDFKAYYPEKLGIFIPIEVEHSNISNVFPKSFEDYFRHADSEIAHLARLMEMNLENKLKGLGVEYIPGKVLERQENIYTIFRFDGLIEPSVKTDALCRVKFRKLSFGDRNRITNLNPRFHAMATSLDGREYLYWIMPISEFLTDVNKTVTESVFAMA